MAQGSSRGRCPAEHLVNPANTFYISKNLELQRASEYQEAVQVSPQRVSLKMRVSKYINFQENFYDPFDDGYFVQRRTIVGVQVPIFCL